MGAWEHRTVSVGTFSSSWELDATFTGAYCAGPNRFTQLYDTQGATRSLALPAANSAAPFSSGFSSYVKVHTEWAANLGTWPSSSHDSHCCVLFWDFPRQCLGVAGDVCAL